jgi:ABC-2 type transport system permease protein
LSVGLVTPLESNGVSEKVRSASLLDWLLPATPIGAIAKRTMIYYRRDPRRIIGALSLFLMPFIVMLPLMLGQSAASDSGGEAVVEQFMPVVLAYCPVLVAWMIATVVSTDISYDGSALGTQIITGASGLTDRWGRNLALSMIFVPVQVAYILGFAAFGGGWHFLPSVFGIASASFLGGMGVGAWLGSVWQYAQPPPGSNPFRKGASGGFAAFAVSMLSMIVPVLLAVPSVIFAIMATNDGSYQWASLAVGLVIGALALWVGTARGAKRLERSWPEALAKVTWKG